MFIAYKPELSFHGALHWEMHGGEPAAHELSATYIEKAPTAADDGWIYASVGDTYSGLKPVGVGLDLVSARLVGLKFWFGCYYCEGHDSYRYCYKLTVYDDRQAHNPFQLYALDTSRNGYLAVYKDSAPHMAHAKGPLWELKDVDPWDIKRGASLSNIKLMSPSGKPVRRKMEEYFPYLNDQSGHDTQFTLNVTADATLRPW